jgi:hypothetical protein
MAKGTSLTGQLARSGRPALFTEQLAPEQHDHKLLVCDRRSPTAMLTPAGARLPGAGRFDRFIGTAALDRGGKGVTSRVGLCLGANDFRTQKRIRPPKAQKAAPLKPAVTAFFVLSLRRSAPSRTPPNSVTPVPLLLLFPLTRGQVSPQLTCVGTHRGFQDLGCALGEILNAARLSDLPRDHPANAP